MGFSSSIGAIILFTGLLVIFSSVYGIIRGSITEVTEDYMDRADWSWGKTESDLDILYSYYNRSSGKLDVGVLNAGSVAFEDDEISAMVNGTVVSGDTDVFRDFSACEKVLPGYEVRLNMSGVVPNFDMIGESQRFNSLPYDPPTDAVNISYWDAHYVLANQSTYAFAYRYHLWGELDWFIYVSDRVRYARHILVRGPIFIATESIVAHYDSDGNYVKTVGTGDDLDIHDLGYLNGKLYIANGSGGVTIYDATTGNYDGKFAGNIDFAFGIVANSTRLFVIDNKEHIDVFDGIGNHKIQFGNHLSGATSVTVTDYLSADAVFVLENRTGNFGINCYDTVGNHLGNISVKKSHPQGPDEYTTIDNGGSIFLFSKESGYTVDLRLGYRMWFHLHNGDETFALG